MESQGEFLCGANRYNPELLGSCASLLANLHRLAQQTKNKYIAAKPLNTYIYSASTCGMLAAMVFDQYDRFAVQGYLDQKGSFSNEVSHELGVFFEQPRRVFNIERECPPDIDLVVCATAPAHYPFIQAKLHEKLPGVPVAFVHHAAEYASGQALPAPALTPLLIATTGRCGTHWFKCILRFLLGPLGYEEVNASSSHDGKRIIDHRVFEKMRPHQYVIDHFRLTPELREHTEQKKISAIFLYRDPRDIQVSSAFYWDKRFTFDVATVLGKAREISLWSRLEKVFLLRYEELSLDTWGSLQRLVEFIGFTVPPDILQKICEFNSFQYLSGGRPPGQEDRAHHYRKGIIGDWKNHYTEENKETVKMACGQLLIDIGYEKDWCW